MKSLYDALMDLDPENQNHWTSDGLPKVDALRFATGNPTLTRDDITNAAPLFTRDNRVMETPEAEEPVVSADPVLHETIQVAQEQENEERKEIVTMSVEIKATLSEALRNLLEPEALGNVKEYSDAELASTRDFYRNVVTELQLSKQVVDSMITDALACTDALILEQEARAPQTKMTAIQMHLQAQKNRTVEDMHRDNLVQNPIDDPVHRMVTTLQRRMGR